MVTLDALVQGAIQVKNSLDAKDIIEIGNSLEEHLENKKKQFCSARGYKKQYLKDDIEVLEGILKKFEKAEL